MGVETMKIYLKHLVQVGGISELDETGKTIIQAHLEKFENGLSKNLQQVIDKAGVLASLRNQVPKNKCEEHATECLNLAIKQLSGIYGKLIHEGFEGGQAALSVETLKKWQVAVSSVQNEVFMIYLLWCGYYVNS